MPRPGNTPRPSHEFLAVPNLPWLNEALGGGFARGGVYLYSGEPGVGKSTLMTQVLGNLAQAGTRVLYATNEQSLDEIEAVLARLFATKAGRIPPRITVSFYIEDRVREVDDLPKFLTRQVLPSGQEYHGVEVIVFDSIQGRGLSANASHKFRVLYEFTEIAKADGLVTILLGHINKAGQIAGPKTLEHNVDCTLYMRKALRMRPFFVPKNRFGPAVLDPIALVMDGGRLVKSPQATAKSATALGYAGALPEIAEVQASVGLAKFGTSPRLNAPSLPRPKISQIVKVLGEIKDVDLSELSYEVNAYVPDWRGYSVELDLPLAVSLLSSFLQQPVPAATLFVGEIDLTRRIRPPKREYLERLAQLLVEERPGEIRRVYVAEKAAGDLAEMIPDVRGVASLDVLLRELWPSLFG